VTNVGAAVNYSADSAFVQAAAQATIQAVGLHAQVVQDSAQHVVQHNAGAAAVLIQDIESQANSHVAQQFARAEERILAERDLINREAEERIRAERDAASQQRRLVQQTADDAHRRIQQLEAQLIAATTATTMPRNAAAPTVETNAGTVHRDDRSDLSGALPQGGASVRNDFLTPMRDPPVRAAGQFAIGATATAAQSLPGLPQHNNLGSNGTDPNSIEEGNTTISSASQTLLRHTEQFLDPMSLFGALPQGGASGRGPEQAASECPAGDSEQQQPQQQQQQ
jgi:hypothetical protein